MSMANRRKKLERAIESIKETIKTKELNKQPKNKKKPKFPPQS